MTVKVKVEHSNGIDESFISKLSNIIDELLGYPDGEYTIYFHDSNELHDFTTTEQICLEKEFQNNFHEVEDGVYKENSESDSIITYKIFGTQNIYENDTLVNTLYAYALQD